MLKIKHAPPAPEATAEELPLMPHVPPTPEACRRISINYMSFRFHRTHNKLFTMKAKSILAALLLLVAGLQTAWGQGFRVYKSDGTVAQFSLRTDSIVFYDGIGTDVDFGPFTPVNQCIVGTWYKSKSETVTFREDGTTDYISGGTYQFFPYQGTIIIYNASGAPMYILKVYNLTSERMLVGTPGSEGFHVWSTTPLPILVQEIRLSNTTLSMTPDETRNLTVTVLPVDAENPEVTWSSSNEDVAEVSKKGKVIANDLGTCTITCSATDGSGIYAECQVTVEYIGEVTPNPYVGDGTITFGTDMLQNTTRAGINNAAAANILGNNFYVTGTKGTEGANNPTETCIFDNFLVHFETNTAGTTESNTDSWEYVGITPGSGNWTNYASLGTFWQTIKYWDYSTAQYDFLAFSTGTYKPVKSTTPAAGEIGVTPMKYGAGLAGSAVAYTFTLPDAAALKQAYITDIVKVTKANYGKEVTLRFKNLGSKVRLGIYETVPGYSVKDVKFYQLDGTTDFTDANKNITAKLICSTGGFPTNGKIEVAFPYVGTSNSDDADYNKAFGYVSAGTTTEAYHGFGTLSNFAAKESGEPAGNIYLGRTPPTATFAGETAADYYQTMFPISPSSPLTLRVDFTLVSIDGSNEEIHVYGAKAVVPTTYLNWLPNYAYTYIFKISDNTNGWTSPIATDPAGLFPITFDAVVVEATDATGQQTTITTVATPSITTYQEGHAYKTNEYSIATAKDIYVQVMDNSTVPATLVATLSDTNSLLYKVSDAATTEANVMDALLKRTTAHTVANVTGRNGLTLTKDANINNMVTKVRNSVYDEEITVAAGSAAEIKISGLTAGTYAYVYDYTSGAKTEVDEFQLIHPGATAVGESGKTYYTLTTTTLNGIFATTAADEAPNSAYIYFSKISDGAPAPSYTYSYVSVIGKTKLPKGLVKVAKSTITSTALGTDAPVAGTFYFDKYFSNNGKYAVKVIKIVA